MRQFVLDVLAQKQFGNGFLSREPYSDWLGENGNHVGLILFNDTVCAPRFTRDKLRMTAGVGSRITRYIRLPGSRTKPVRATRLVVRIES